MTQAETYRSASAELLRKAEEALAQDDLVQASEKGWGAAAQAVKAVAQRRRWPHNGHRQLFDIIRRIADETGDRTFHELFSVANALHTSFYENWMSKETVETDLERVRDLVSRLLSLA